MQISMVHSHETKHCSNKKEGKLHSRTDISSINVAFSPAVQTQFLCTWINTCSYLFSHLLYRTEALCASLLSTNIKKQT